MNPPQFPKPPRVPRIPRAIEEELREYLREQKEADIKGSLDRLADLFMRHDAEDKQRHEELRGDVRGMSLRVGQLERYAERTETRLKYLEGRTDKNERDIDESGRWILRDQDSALTRARERPFKIVAVIASLIAILATIFHLIR